MIFGFSQNSVEFKYLPIIGYQQLHENNCHLIVSTKIVPLPNLPSRFPTQEQKRVVTVKAGHLLNLYTLSWSDFPLAWGGVLSGGGGMPWSYWNSWADFTCFTLPSFWSLLCDSFLGLHCGVGHGAGDRRTLPGWSALRRKNRNEEWRRDGWRLVLSELVPMSCLEFNGLRQWESDKFCLIYEKMGLFL